MDGAAWKDNKIVLNLPESNTPSIIQNITFAYATQRDSDDNKNEKNIVELPLYSNSSRTSFICSIRVVSAASAKAVTLSGAAIVVAEA